MQVCKKKNSSICYAEEPLQITFSYKCQGQSVAVYYSKFYIDKVIGITSPSSYVFKILVSTKDRNYYFRWTPQVELTFCL